MESGARPGAATMRHHDSVIGAFRQAGFSVAATALAYNLMDSYVYGFALQQRNLPFASSAEIAEVAQGILQSFPPADYPHLAELIFEHVLKPAYDYGDEFEFRARPGPREPRAAEGRAVVGAVIAVCGAGEAPI